MLSWNGVMSYDVVFYLHQLRHRERKIESIYQLDWYEDYLPGDWYGLCNQEVDWYF